jgi:hypothetical protein
VLYSRNPYHSTCVIERVAQPMSLLRRRRFSRPATVIGRWGDDTALLRTDDGETVEVPVPERLRARVDVGASVEMLDDGSVDWHVAEESGA